MAAQKFLVASSGLEEYPREVTPYTTKIDALATGHKPFGIRPMKVEVPKLEDAAESQEYDHGTLSSPAHEGIRSVRCLNHFCLKAWTVGMVESD